MMSMMLMTWGRSILAVPVGDDDQDADVVIEDDGLMIVLQSDCLKP